MKPNEQQAQAPARCCTLAETELIGVYRDGLVSGPVHPACGFRLHTIRSNSFCPVLAELKWLQRSLAFKSALHVRTNSCRPSAGNESAGVRSGRPEASR